MARHESLAAPGKSRRLLLSHRGRTIRTGHELRDLQRFQVPIEDFVRVHHVILDVLMWYTLILTIYRGREKYRVQLRVTPVARKVWRADLRE